MSDSKVSSGTETPRDRAPSRKSRKKRDEKLSEKLLETVESLLNRPSEEIQKDLDHLLRRVRDLVRRKEDRKSTKGDTRDLFAEVLFSRLSHGFEKIFAKEDLGENPRMAAELIMGAVLTGSVLDEFSAIFERVLTEATLPRDYHLAGRADFISVNELLQLLNAGKHSGRLILERPDNHLDIFLKNGSIAFVDPQFFRQRMIRGKGLSPWREISPELLDEVNRIRATEGTPVLISMKEKGFFKESEFKEQVRTISSELIYDFLQNEHDCSFSYKALDSLPEHSVKYCANLAVMPLLLEAHKRMDDWRQIRRVFPDLNEPIQPAPDLFARIAEMNLGVVSIKVLTLINGSNSFNDIADTVGLGTFDLGSMLVDFARQGILEPPGGPESLLEESLGALESMEAAAEALEANEALDSIPESLDRVFGEEEEGFGLGFLKAAREDGEEEPD